MFLNFYKMQLRVTYMPNWIVAPSNLGKPFKETPSGIMFANAGENAKILTVFSGVLFGKLSYKRWGTLGLTACIGRYLLKVKPAT